jgi:hypothetical protein
MNYPMIPGEQDIAREFNLSIVLANLIHSSDLPLHLWQDAGRQQ